VITGLDDLLATPRWRSVGPSRGGRVVAVAGHPDDQAVFYFGGCAGGVWKTTDAGSYWRNVSDGFLESSPVGAIAVSRSHPDTVWVGTGESCTRNDVVAGDGVYRSTDGGDTWVRAGLEETRHISRVRIDDHDPNRVWVAALGDIFGPSPDRGVYRTEDGGATWRRLLHVSDRAGAADLSVDPTDPAVAFAAIWQAVRRPWEMSSGGEDSDLYRTVDGGETWTSMSDSPGFPTGLKGRIGVSVSPARPQRVYAVVEADDGASGIYRSDDRGDTWTKVNGEAAQTGRPWYYSHVFADPVDENVVWTCNLSFWRSADGGETFTQIQTPHGDNHDLWLDPADPRRLIQGNDGGACVSFNGGLTFSSIYNQPTAQIYRVDVSPEFPHDLFGTQQDNSGIRVPSRSWKGAIRWTDCLELGEAEAGDVAVDPVDPRFVLLGGAGFGHPGPLLRVDQVTEQAQDVAVCVDHFGGTAPSTHRHRFGWTYPISFSPHERHRIYACGERVFTSTDAGMSWTAISPDLTRDDPELQRVSGGPITKDTSGAEVFCTIHAFAESPRRPGLLWAGSDDGLVHVSADAGTTWQDVTPAVLPALTTISGLEPAVDDPSTVYLVGHRYRLQDRRPCVYVSHDLGSTWEDLTGDLPEACITRCLRQDRVNPDILYLATDLGVRVSVDRGRRWRPLGHRLPPTPVYDLTFRDHELVAATHGRGFWMLDDLTPVREATAPDRPVLLHTPAPVTRYPTPTGFDMPGTGTWVGGFPGVPLGGAAFTREQQADGSVVTVMIDGGENPPDGVAIWYRLAEAQDPGVTIEIADGSGRLLRRLGGPAVPGRPAPTAVPATAGLHRQVWDLRVEPPAGPPGADGTVAALTPGPRVPPGRYRITVRAGDTQDSGTVDIRRDPRIFSDDAALRAQFDLLLTVRDALDHIGRLAAWISDQPEDDRLAGIRRRLCGGSKDYGEALKRVPSLSDRIVLLPEIVVELSDTPPTAAVRQSWDTLAGQLDDIEAELTALGLPEHLRRTP
jgi:photosystem II stability/assembly factor-like uncharacterized protein